MSEQIDFSQFVGPIPTSLEVPTVSGKTEFGRKWFGRRVSDHDRADFCIQLSVLLKAKVSLQRSLEVIEKQCENSRMKEAVASLRVEIHRGGTFAQALKGQPEIFTSMFVTSAEVGQESGRLEEVFGELARHLEQMNQLKTKFRQAMTYPILVVGVAVAVVLFFLLYIVPTFADLFKSFSVELPLATRILLRISGLLIAVGPYVLVGITILGLVIVKGWSRQNIRDSVQEYAIKIPILGSIILKSHVARFCRTLGTLLHAEVLLVEALVTARRTLSLRGLQAEIDKIIILVKQGNTVAGPLIESKYFPPIVAQMIAVGEETSELDTMLLKVAEYFEGELQSKVETLASVAEPILILLLGLVVGGILISLYLPMFDLANGFGN